MDALRSINFKWPTADVLTIRRDHLIARRAYRQASPGALNLTLSSFTEMAFEVGRQRSDAYHECLAPTWVPGGEYPREQLALTWRLDATTQLDDDWEDVAHAALRHQSGTTTTQRPPVWKSDIARLAVLNGLHDWGRWLPSCRNDARRTAFDSQRAPKRP